MSKQLLAVVFAACVADGVEGTPGSLPADEGSSQVDLAVTQRMQLLDDPRCKLLPADDGACAHACDPDALKAFIPPNTCASFACTLTDGSTLIAGGCNR
jgi:hypothetical protein